MFELINDVERYPLFVPGCHAAQVLERRSDLIRARLTVGAGALRTSFTTRNRLEPDRHIHMDLEEGPFRSLTGRWTLEPLQVAGDDAPGCSVELVLRFEVKGGLTGLALAPMVERMAASLVDAFVMRAQQEHAQGKPGPAAPG